MPVDMTPAETFLFTFTHHGERLAVRIKAQSLQAAQARFRAMSRAEKLARVVAPLERIEPDAAAGLAHWFAGLFARRRAA